MTPNKYITALDYAGKTLLLLSVASSGVFLHLFTTITGTPVGNKAASISLVFLISNEVIKMFLKTMNISKIALLARSKLNSIYLRR